MCLRVTRQDASAFNQPLSLDTFRVTNMHYMFQVRPPARAIWPQSPLGPSVHAACTATTLHALPPLSPRVPPSVRSDPRCTLCAPPPPPTPSCLHPRVSRPV